MLVLSRKVNQIVAIGDDIKVIILDVRGNVVKIGITAPTKLLILREELQHRDRS